jgi:hypothetical protein
MNLRQSLSCGRQPSNCHFDVLHSAGRGADAAASNRQDNVEEAIHGGSGPAKKAKEQKTFTIGFISF